MTMRQTPTELEKEPSGVSEPSPSDQSDVISIRRRGRSHRHYRSGRRVSLIMALGGLSLLVAILALFGIIQISSLSNTNDLLRVRLEESEQKLIDATKELRQTHAQLEAAVEGRFPHLRKLEFDKVVPLHEGLIKNILFTLIRKSDQNYYEYKVVMENDTDSVSVPEVNILLFSQLGIQLGTNEIPKQEPLLRGESRSYSAVIDLAVPGEPYYFYVAIR